MNTLILVLILLGAVLLLAAGLIAWLVIRARRSVKLREKFGPEYDYTMQITGDKRAAEETLAEREKRVKKLAIQTLDPDKLNQYKIEWGEIQTDFVDKPTASVEKANRLITEVMVARGFPVEDFEQRVADISVLYPEFVSNYRNAHAIALASQHDGVSTEDLRQAMIYYRSLFEVLLETEGNQEKVYAMP
jgi:hypothetical protein